MSSPHPSVESIRAELSELAKDMDKVIDNVIGAVPEQGVADEFEAECFRDALKTARSHRFALEALSRRVGELLGSQEGGAS